MSNNKGFTLIEILVGLVLFAVGAVVFAQMQVLSVKGSSFGKDALTAITLGEQNLEQLKNTSFNAIAGNTVVSREHDGYVDGDHLTGQRRADTKLFY